MTYHETLTENTAPDSTMENAGLELAMQELEPLEAPSFWSGFKVGVELSGIGVASYVASAAVTT